MSTRISSSIQPGQRLPKGTTVIDYARTRDRRDSEHNLFRFGMVLAVSLFPADEYGTWEVTVAPLGAILTHHGQYHDTLSSALEDYEQRA